MDDRLSSTRKKLLWRCRRGTKELDVVLSRFVKNQLDQLAQDEIELLEQLLEIQDPVLQDWLLNEVKPTDQGMVKIVRKILSSHIS